MAPKIAVIATPIFCVALVAPEPAANASWEGAAICGCDKAFIVSDFTEYVSVGGRTYACCSHTCYELATDRSAAVAQDFQRRLVSRQIVNVTGGPAALNERTRTVKG